MKITLERIQNIAQDIKEDDSWVNDSHTYTEYKGICYGLDTLINHIKEISNAESRL
jgi:hypothetical protein